MNRSSRQTNTNPFVASGVQSSLPPAPISTYPMTSFPHTSSFYIRHFIDHQSAYRMFASLSLHLYGFQDILIETWWPIDCLISRSQWRAWQTYVKNVPNLVVRLWRDEYKLSVIANALSKGSYSSLRFLQLSWLFSICVNNDFGIPEKLELKISAQVCETRPLSWISSIQNWDNELFSSRRVFCCRVVFSFLRLLMVFPESSFFWVHSGFKGEVRCTCVPRVVAVNAPPPSHAGLSVWAAFDLQHPEMS